MNENLCSALVPTASGVRACLSGARCMRNGKPYCGVHDPLKVKTRQAHKEARVLAEVARDDARLNLRAAEHVLAQEARKLLPQTHPAVKAYVEAERIHDEAKRHFASFTGVRGG